MNQVTLFVLTLFLFSCSIHSSVGLIDSAFGGKFKTDVHKLSVFYTSIQMETTPYENDSVAVSIGAGPSITVPFGGRSPLYGAEISNRITFKNQAGVSPYLFHAHGIQYHDSPWYWETHVNPVEPHGSDVRYEFSTRLGAGIAYQVTEKLTVDISYQWVHFSNGEHMFGDKTRQLFHLPKAKVNEGFESGALFIGVQYEF
jgi:opacity protein-like surface antigen